MPEWWKPDIRERTVDTKMRLARLVANKDTWQRSVEVETHKHRDKEAPRALKKLRGKVQAEAKARQRIEHLKHACVVERKGTRNQIAKKKMMMNKVQRSLSKQFGAWLFKTLLRMIIAITVRNTKEVQNVVMD